MRLKISPSSSLPFLSPHPTPFLPSIPSPPTSLPLPPNSLALSPPRPARSKLESLLRLGHLLFDPIRTPRHPIVLCHGLYGFAVRGPSSFPRFQIHYWGKLLEILRKRLGVKVIIGKVPATGSIEARARCLDEMLVREARGGVNMLAHSMGGLDARYLISHIKPDVYRPVSLTTVCTPHRGSPFMDWCRANIGVGLQSTADGSRPVPFSLKEPLLRPAGEPLGYLPNNLLKLLILNLLDSPAYSNLSTDFLERSFNPATPDDPGVQYFSIAARIASERLSAIHPFWVLSLLMDRLGGAAEGGHDGLVTVQSARWGEFLGVVDGTDHWEIRGSAAFGASGSAPDALLNQQAKTSWLELNRYIGRWLTTKHTASKPEPDDEPHSSSIHALADWLARRLPSSLIPQNPKQLVNGYRRTVDPGFPLNDIGFHELSQDQRKEKTGSGMEKFELEKLYTAICRNLYDQGL